jgi:hypothetical protein
MKTRRVPARFHPTALLSTEAQKWNNPQIAHADFLKALARRIGAFFEGHSQGFGSQKPNCHVAVVCSEICVICEICGLIFRNLRNLRIHFGTSVCG